MKLAHTRKIIDAIHDGTLLEAEYVETPIFNLAVPTQVNGVPSEVLQPQNAVCEEKPCVFCDVLWAGFFVVVWVVLCSSEGW